MSLLRICSFAKCLNRRSLLVNCPVGESCCRLCLSVRSGACRRISETPLQLQRRNLALVIPKEDVKRRVLEQSQLLDVLDARILQLRSDVVQNVHKSKVQILTAPSSGRVSSGSLPKRALKDKTTIADSGKTLKEKKGRTSKEKKEMSKSQSSGSTGKITPEKETKQQKQKKAAVKKAGKSKGSQSMKPGMSFNKFFTSVDLSPHLIQKSRDQEELSNEVSAAESTGKINVCKQKLPVKEDQKKTDTDAPPCTPDKVDEVQEVGRKVKQQVSQQRILTDPVHLQERDNTHANSIHSYLYACVFIGDLELAHTFLLNYHRLPSKRNLLQTDSYNILMRVWAKKGTLHQIGRMFILLEEANLKPNLGSYCAALESMGRNATCAPRVISRCLAQMEADNLSLDSLFGKCAFQKDERDMVLKAVQVVRPGYQPDLKASMTQGADAPLIQDYYTQREDHRYAKLDFTKEDLQQRLVEQLDIEKGCTVTIDSVEASKPVTKDMCEKRNLLEKLQVQWQKVLLQAFRENRAMVAKRNNKRIYFNIYPYLCLLDDTDYVNIMLQTVNSIPVSGDTLRCIASQLGNRVYTQYSVREKYHNQTVEKLGNIYNGYTELLAKDTQVCDVLPREKWCQLQMEHSSGPTLQGTVNTWPFMVVLEIGTFMADMMVKHLKIDSDILNRKHKKTLIPVLYHMYTFRKDRQIGFIKPHPLLIQIKHQAMETKLTFDSYVMPMLCPPVPWVSPTFGSYLLTPTKLMRSADGDTQHDALLAKSKNLNAVLDSLNHLSNCAWKINGPLLDIIISIFNDRGSEKLDIPPPMLDPPKLSHFNSTDATLTSAEKASIKRDLINAKKKFSEMYSLRMDALYKLSIANHVRDKIFWFPHNMDFRGRTYPCPPHFNHLGSDLSRAILTFAEGKPLGPKGLDWLKIHLVNLTGLKKRSSLQGRLEYANSIMDDILDSADNPLNGKKWWMNADEPWQALACCMEIAKAVRSPDPEQFISHCPVHQDGSCNGLQHYAALGRDVIGATSVNLMPCNEPQDVYSGVAQQVEEFRARDAANGLKIAQVLEGFISRKVVKQTVMTVVYGVTRFGGRLQIEKRLEDIEDFPQEHVWKASHYLVSQVFLGLKEMFTGTRAIQDWLTDSARLISKAGHSVEWVTPLGLPIIQPYHRKRSQVVKCEMQSVKVKISHDVAEKPDTVKQKNAFPPNFIHSLDSTHMMLTALHCCSAGLTFVSVHDCFWTHPCNVDAMNKICREQFVALHSQPILQQLSSFLLQKYGSTLPENATKKTLDEYTKLIMLLNNVPQTGDFDLQRVKESVYFFS